MNGNGILGLNGRVGTDRRGIEGLNGLRGTEASCCSDDPSKMDIKKLIEEIMRLVKQLMAAQGAEQGGEAQGGAPASGGAQEAGAPEGLSQIDWLNELMEELRKRNPQAVENAAQAIPGGTQALTAAANATAAASAPVGLPSGFA